MFDNKIKGILSLISSIFTQIIIGNAFTFGNFIIYYKSYLYHNNVKDITVLDLLYVVPTACACLNILPIITGFLDKLLGIRILTIISTICLLISQFIIYYYTEYYLMIISYAIYGFAGSITYLPTLKNCWKYYPNKKGLISGILFSSCGLSTFLFTTIGDWLINPKAESEIGKQLYSKDIAMRYLNYLQYYIICIIILGTISSILSFPFEEEANVKEIDIDKTFDDKENKNNLIEDNKINEKDYIINDENDKRYSVNSDKEGEGKNKNIVKGENLTLKESIFSFQFLLCFIIVGCTLLFSFLLTNTYRTFGLEMELDELGIQILSKVYTLLNTFARIIWGLIYDKCGFKYPYIFVCINQIICSSLIYFSAKNIITYFVVCCFGVISFSGHMILFPNLVTKKFGVDNSVILLGFCGIVSGITSLIGPILTSQLIKSNSDYLKTYLAAGSTTIISLLLTIIVKVEKMKKNNENNDNNIENTNNNEKNKEEKNDSESF